MPSGRPRTVVRHLSPGELDDAIRRARVAGDATILQRLCFVKNCYAGDTATAAAGRVGVSRTTGTRWLDRWNEAAVAGLEPAPRPGRPPRLAGAERSTARELIREAAPLTTVAVRDLLAREFDVEYAVGYLPRLLRSMGFEYVDPDAVGEESTGGGGGARAGSDEGPGRGARRRAVVVPAASENHTT